MNYEALKTEVAGINNRLKEIRQEVKEAIIDELVKYENQTYKLKKPLGYEETRMVILHEGDYLHGIRYKDGRIWVQVSRKTDWIIQLGDRGWFYILEKSTPLLEAYDIIKNKK